MCLRCYRGLPVAAMDCCPILCTACVNRVSVCVSAALVAPYCSVSQMWNYVYFIIHLYKLHQSDMNGLETRIFDQLMVSEHKREPDLTWMDLHKLSQWRDDDRGDDDAAGDDDGDGDDMTRAAVAFAFTSPGRPGPLRESTSTLALSPRTIRDGTPVVGAGTPPAPLGASTR